MKTYGQRFKLPHLIDLNISPTVQWDFSKVGLPFNEKVRGNYICLNLKSCTILPQFRMCDKFIPMILKPSCCITMQVFTHEMNEINTIALEELKRTREQKTSILKDFFLS